MLNTSPETHDGLTLGLEIIHSTISSLNIFVIVLYIEWTIIYFNVKFYIMDIFTLTLLTKLRADLRPSLISFVKHFILGSKRVDLESPVFI